MRSARAHAAVLRPTLAQERLRLGRVEVAPRLRPWVDYAWWVRWSTPAPHVQEVVPRPVVHVSAEVVAGEARLVVHGVHRRMFRRTLEGEGSTVALAFRPAGFRAFLRGDVSALTGREQPADTVLGVDDRPAAAAALACDAPEDGAAVLTEWLGSLGAEPDPLGLRLAALVERVEEDTTLLRAEQLADLEGVSLRTLQRWFGAYVGVGPKWVVQRSRLLDVTSAAHAGPGVDWAALAARLGYADQSHLIRAFTRLVGHPPASYVREG